MAEAGDSNKSRQDDEVEALTAIYGNEWCVINSESRKYCIKISDSLDDPKLELNLQIVLPDDYPLQSPPEYQLNAPWLRGDNRIDIQNKLADIYCDNMGENIIYLWVEAVREFLQEMADSEIPSTISPDSSMERTAEAEADEEFDDSDLGEYTYVYHQPTASRHSNVSCPDIISGETMTDRKSTFQAHLARVTHKDQVEIVLNRLMENKKIAHATHNIMAFRILTDRPDVPHQGCDDDGESGASIRMLHLLQIMKADNVMVVVTRWYGGIHLGPDRFKHINNCARIILEDNGFQRSKDEKKGPRSKKK